MDSTPYEVSQQLYSGIYDSIERLKARDERGSWSDIDSSTFLDVGVAIDWYLKHCVLSGKSLEDNYVKLRESVEGKYFIYNFASHYRFTLHYDLLGNYREQQNNLILKKSLPQKKIEVGQIFKFNGFHIRVTNVFDTLNPNHGSFIAKTLTVEELINMKKGEN